MRRQQPGRGPSPTAAEKRRLPAFRTEKEEAEFWATHDTADYWDQFEDLEEPIELDPELAHQIDRRARKKQLVSIRLETWQVRLAKAIAVREGVPYHAVLRRWIRDGIPRARARSS